MTIQVIKAALSPYCNEDMDPEMREAWLTDLAAAAQAAMLRENWSPPHVVAAIVQASGGHVLVPDSVLQTIHVYDLNKRPDGRRGGFVYETIAKRSSKP